MDELNEESKWEFIHPDALKGLSRYDPTVPVRAQQLCANLPALNVLEFLMDTNPEWQFTLASRGAAEYLSKELPAYSMSGTQTCRKCLVVQRATAAISKFVRGSEFAETGLLAGAFSRFSAWPVLYQDAVITELDKVDDPDVGVMTKAIKGSDPEPVESEEYLECMQALQGDNSARDLLSAPGGDKVAKMFAPKPSDTLGNGLIKSAIECVLPLGVSNSKKIELLEDVGKSAAKVDKLKSPLPHYVMGILSKSKENLPDVLGDLVKQLGKPSPLSVLMRPKQRQQKKRDFVLVRDKDGKILCSHVEVRKGKKQDLPEVDVSEPVPIARPLGRGDVGFKVTPGGDLEPVLNRLVDDKLVHVNKIQKDKNVLSCKLSKELKKKMVPRSKLKGLKKSLSHGLEMDRESQELDSLYI